MIIANSSLHGADFGLAEGLPLPGRDSPIDSVDDFFRIRLVCTLLDTCGACFDRGSQKRRLDHFLVVFQVRFFVFFPLATDLTWGQLYTVCKGETPIDVSFMLSDTLDVSALLLFSSLG